MNEQIAEGGCQCGALRYRVRGQAIAHLMAPLLATASITGEVLGTPNAEMRKNLTGPEPKLFTPWMAMQAETGD